MNYEGRIPGKISTRSSKKKQWTRQILCQKKASARRQKEQGWGESPVSVVIKERYWEVSFILGNVKGRNQEGKHIPCSGMGREVKVCMTMSCRCGEGWSSHLNLTIIVETVGCRSPVIVSCGGTAWFLQGVGIWYGATAAKQGTVAGVWIMRRKVKVTDPPQTICSFSDETEHSGTILPKAAVVSPSSWWKEFEGENWCVLIHGFVRWRVLMNFEETA